MQNAPFFTIGIPVYNAEKYLSQCLDSILNQSFCDFELILVNDGSKDNSLNICKNYQAKDSRIIIIDQKNGGVSAASNQILAAASGKYVYLMDNDDEMYEGILQNAYRYLCEKEVDILHGGYYVFTPHDGIKLRLFRNPDILGGFDTLSDYLKYESDVGFSTSMWTKFVRRDFWQTTGVTFESKYDGCQDLDVSRRLMRGAKTVRYVDDIILTWYHPREGSISTEWSYPMMRNYWRLVTDMFREARIELSSQGEYLWEQYKQKIVRDSGTNLWRVNAYSNEQQRELGKIIRPIRPYFSYKYAPDKRTAFLFLAIKYLGVRNAALIVASIRKLKHIALGR